MPIRKLTLMVQNWPKKILYIDMDGVLVDFESAINLLPLSTQLQYRGQMDNVPGIFGLMQPKPGAIEAFNRLSQFFDVYILSTAPWDNPTAWSDKLLWIKTHLGEEYAHKKLILSAHKHLNVGHYLIDDRLKNGVDKFTGIHIHFGTKDFPDWPTVVDWLISQPLGNNNEVNE
jgi:5'-nucleotidase